MKKLQRVLIIALIQSLFSPLVLANTPTLVPLPSVDDFSKGEDGWSFGLGFGVEYETAYEGSDEFGLEIEPAGGLQWRQGNDVLFFAGEAIGWRGAYEQGWFFEVVVGFDEGRKESDSDEGWLKGLGDQDEGAELVLQARRALDNDWRNWLVGRVVTSADGNLGLFGVGHRFGTQNDGTGSEVNVVAVFHDSKYANKGFGINAIQAMSSGLDNTMLSGGLRSVGVNYNFRNQVADNWQVYGEALFEYFAEEVRESPIARNNYEAEIGAGFIYIF